MTSAVYWRWLQPQRLCCRSARHRTDFCRPLGPPPHHAVRPSSTHDARSITQAGWSDVSSRVSAGVGVRKVAADVPASLRRYCAVTRPTTSSPRGAAPHHAYASKATPRSWGGFRPGIYAPAARRSSCLRGGQAKTHYGEVVSTRDQLQEHHERLLDYAHNCRGDACGYDDGHRAHGACPGVSLMRNSTHPTGLFGSTSFIPAAWFGANSGLQKAPPPDLTQRQRVTAGEKRVRALMEVDDLK